MNRPKAHHKVPRFYLEGFRTVKSGTGKKTRLWVYRWGESEPRLSKPSQTGFENNFYSLIDSDGQWDPALEELLARYVDGPASAFWKDLSDPSHVLTREERLHISIFIAFLFTRTSNIRRAMSSAFARLEETITKILEVAEQRASDPTWKGIPATPTGRGNTYRIENIEDLRLEHNDLVQMTGVAAAEIATIVHRMRWTFFHAPGGSSFITSDNPVARVNPFVEREWLSADIERHGVEVSLPISRQCCLVCSYHLPSAHIEADTDTVLILNSRTLKWSTDEVYTPERHEWLDEAFFGKGSHA